MTTRGSLRALGRRPLFALVAVTTLAVGVGVNTAMFSLANALLLRPLPFPDAGRLARLYRSTPANLYGDFSAAETTTLVRNGADAGTFAAYRTADLTWDEGPPAAQWLESSASLFGVLGMAPAAGRFFSESDVAAGNSVVVISYRVWRDQFQLAPNVIGTALRAGGRAFEIVGVLPIEASDHRLFGRVGLFSPFRLPSSPSNDLGQERISILWKRHASVSADEAAARIGAIHSQAHLAGGSEPTEWRSEPLAASTTGPTGKALVAMLLGLALSVLLIACSNLAGVLVAHTIDRRRECALRAALGASAWQLARPFLIESAALATAGLAAGLLIAGGVTRWLSRSIADGGGLELLMDWRVVAFAGLAASVTFVATSMAPALLSLHFTPSAAIGSGTRNATAGRSANRLRAASIAVQFALAVVLLTTAGAFVIGTRGLLDRNYGWRSDHVLQARLELPAKKYSNPEAIAAFHHGLVERLERQQGVAAASVSYGLPYLGLRGRMPVRADRDASNGPTAMLNAVSPGYFDVTGTPLLAGRVFVEGDTSSAPAVAIASASLAKALFGDDIAVGRQLAFVIDQQPRWMTIVGVVADATPMDIAVPPNPLQVYQPIAQDPRTVATVALRTAGVPPAAMLSALRKTVAEVDPAAVVREASPADNLIRTVSVQANLVRELLVGFAGMGGLLALVGLYGSISRLVSERTRELGIRRALGAPSRAVVALVVTAGARAALIGTAAGTIAAIAVVTHLGGVFPGMPTNQLLTPLAVLGLSLITLAVSFVSARRVTTIDPAGALRAE